MEREPSNGRPKRRKSSEERLDEEGNRVTREVEFQDIIARAKREASEEAAAQEAEAKAGNKQSAVAVQCTNAWKLKLKEEEEARVSKKAGKKTDRDRSRPTATQAPWPC
jgi:hypothetical protein